MIVYFSPSCFLCWTSLLWDAGGGLYLVGSGTCSSLSVTLLFNNTTSCLPRPVARPTASHCDYPVLSESDWSERCARRQAPVMNASRQHKRDMQGDFRCT
jgi:hypothetical protein